MILISEAREFPSSWRGCFVTVGNFDGVHLGHRALIDRLRARAGASSARALVLTFQPHPASILRPQLAPEPLVWPAREVELLEQAGADEVGVFATGPWLLSMSARQFFDEILRGLVGARGLVEGPNFAFGQDRQGGVANLAEWSAAAGMEFEVVEAARVGDGLVSSSRIRECIRAGDVALATQLLGRPHRIRGTVGVGAGRGARIGYPTANLGQVEVILPGDGVYAALASIDGQTRRFAAACNLGPNPTFGESARKIEAHLIGFEGDLRGRRIELDFLARLRSTVRFASKDALLEQLAIDVKRAGEVAQAHSATP